MTSSHELAFVLEKARPSLLPATDLDECDPESDLYQHVLNCEVVASDATVTEVEEAVRRPDLLGRFIGENDQIFVHRPGGYVSIRPRNFAEWLLAQTRLRGATGPVSELIEVATTNRMSGQEILVLKGLSPVNECRLPGDITLCNLFHAPQSYARDEILYGGPNQRRASPRRRGALVADVQWAPVLSCTTELVRGGNEKLEQMQEIVRLLPPVVGTAVSTTAHWMHAFSPIHLISGVSASAGFDNDAYDFDVGVSGVFEWSELVSTIESYLALQSNAKRHLRIPLERYNRALLARQLEDKAIELGVALETMLTADRDKDAPISYVLRLRGACLLTRDTKARKEAMLALKRAYDRRSAVAHSGHIGKHPEDARLELEFGIRLCSEMLKIAIARGGLPEDWDDIVLGA